MCAAYLRTPVLRLRASTRARDSLETGASYFRAELTKLTTVIARLDDSPPVFFLLDELLRGTNARARAIGARAVVTHLAGQQARGLVPTHDYTLCDLEDERGVRAVNVHFTDVMVSGEMTFDYKLRPGRATTSNALRLLEMAGIPVPREDFGHELAS